MSWKRIAKDPNKKLNDKQRVYVAAYLETLDGALSAEMAGYAKKSANDTSKWLQRHPAVRAAIDSGLEDLERELKDRCVKTMEHTYCQATADMGDFFDADGNLLPTAQMPRAARRALAAIEVEFETKIISSRDEDGKIVETFFRVPRVAKIKLHDKRASQELFAKYAGRLKDRVELDATQSYADMVLAAQRQREGDGNEAPALPEHADEEPEP